jgi:hypothetical protein
VLRREVVAIKKIRRRDNGTHLGLKLLASRPIPIFIPTLQVIFSGTALCVIDLFGAVRRRKLTGVAARAVFREDDLALIDPFDIRGILGISIVQIFSTAGRVL